MITADEFSQIIDVLNLAVTALIAFVGWNIAFNNDRKIAFRGEIYDSIKTLEGKIESLVSDSASYWKSETLNQDYIRYESLNFELRVEAVSRDIRILAQRGYIIENHSLRLFQFKRAITLDTLYFSKTTPDEKIQKIRDIYLSTEEIITALRGIFKERHIDAKH